MTNIIILLISLFTLVNIIEADVDCEEGWDAYGDQKCLKILTKFLATYDDALAECKLYDKRATLPIIHSQSEQDFVSDLLFTKHKIVDAIWIGAKVDYKVVTWVDGSKSDYANWAPGKPSNISNECVEMVPESSIKGKWIDEPCTKMNLGVCQKMQQWSLDHIEQLLIDYKKEIDDNKNYINNYKKELDATKAELTNLKSNISSISLPIGFIYTQLPSQPDPHAIWPSLEWQNVTPTYAGMFFRAEGGASNKFEGGNQDASSPRLIQVQDYGRYDVDGIIDLVPGTWSKLIVTGKNEWPSLIGLRFMVSNVEVRPQNEAIRIWRRVK